MNAFILPSVTAGLFHSVLCTFLHNYSIENTVFKYLTQVQTLSWNFFSQYSQPCSYWREICLCCITLLTKNFCHIGQCEVSSDYNAAVFSNNIPRIRIILIIIIIIVCLSQKLKSHVKDTFSEVMALWWHHCRYAKAAFVTQTILSKVTVLQRYNFI